MQLIPANPTPVWYAAQVVSIVSLIIVVIGTLSKNDTHLKQLGALGTLLYGVSLAMVGGWVGSAMCVIGAARGLFSSLEKTKHLAPLIFFLQITAAILLWKGPIDLLAISGSLIGTYALFYTKGITMRLLIIPLSLLYIPYSLLLGNPINAIINATILGANLISIYRLLRDKK